MAAVGGTLDDVMQVLIYLTDIADAPVVDAVYRNVFRPPFPNRSTIGGVSLAAPGMNEKSSAFVTL